MYSRINYLFSLLAVIFFTNCTDPQSKEISFTILQMNDVYEIAALDNGKTAGLARVATIRKDLLKENPNTITVLAGDFLSPSLIGNLKIDGEKIKGKQMVEVLNAIGTDYVTFGNHEFDIDEEDLQKRLDESKFKWTSSNTFHKLDSISEPFEVLGKPVSTYVIHSLKNKDGAEIKLGVIGITLPFNKAEYVVYDDFFESFSKTYERIKSECDVVVALTHLNIEDDLELAKRHPDLMMVLGGHDHANMMHKVGNVLVTKADANAKTVYVHKIVFDQTNEKFQISSELMPVNDQVKNDPEVQQIVDKWVVLQNDNLTNLGYSPDSLVFSSKDTLDVLEASIRNHETNFTKMVVEAMLYGQQTADAALMNSGSIRLDDLLLGNIYEFDILKTFPYGGSLVVGKIPGEALKRVMTISTTDNADTGGYLQNINFTFTEGKWLIKGNEIKDAATYAVIIPKFVMEGNEQNLEFLKEFPYETLKTLGPNQVRNDIRDIFIDYKRNN